MPRGKRVIVDTETTGLVASESDVIQFAAIALRDNFTPDKNIPPFCILMRPSKYVPGEEYSNKVRGALAVNGLSIERCLKDGFTAEKGAQLFEEWWKRAGAGLPMEPLAQNWPFDKAHLSEWLGTRAMEDYFVRYYRDTYSAARFIQDRAEAEGKHPLFGEGLSLSKLAKALGITAEKFHTAYDDCLTTAAVYNKLLMFTPS